MKPNQSSVCKLKDGRKLGFIQYGDPSGKPVFFFHGWPGSRYSGSETHEAAKKIGVRIISTDRPGIGLSDFTENRKLLDWPDDITNLADHLGIQKFSVLGVSGGGPYAAACAYKIPKRLHKTGIVVGLAPVNIKGIMNGMSLRGRLGWGNYHRFPFVRTLGTLGTVIQFKYFPALGRLIAFPTKQDRIAYMNAVTNQTGEESGIIEAFRQGIKGPAEELRIYTDDWGFKPKDIRSKVFLWYGAQDTCVSLRMGEYYHSEIPGSTLYVDASGGHLARYAYEEKILNTLTRS